MLQTNLSVCASGVQQQQGAFAQTAEQSGVAAPPSVGWDAGDEFVRAPARVTKDDPNERVELNATLRGSKGRVKQVEGELKRVAFLHDELDVDIQVFDEGGWFRPRVVGIKLNGPRHMVEQIRDQLQEYVDG